MGLQTLENVIWILMAAVACLIAWQLWRDRGRK
jgi:hypothetical protein